MNTFLRPASNNIHSSSKKVFLLFIAYLYFSGGLLAQKVDYDRIILPDELNANIPLEEKLVRLAWKNSPQNRILKHNIETGELEYEQSRKAWLDNFRMVGNLNEAVIDPPEDQPVFFFPRYNFSLSLSLGDLFTSSYQKKTILKQIEIAEENLKQQKINVRAEVLKRYEDFKFFEASYQLQDEITADKYSQYLVAQEKFKNGTISLEEFNVITQSYNTERLNRLNAERDYNKSRIALEQLIGVPLDEVQ